MKGEMSGEKCIKEVMHATFVEAAGWFGGTIGYYIGGEVGRLFGRWIAKTVVEFVLNFLTQWLFGRPKNEALHNAYRYLGVRETASKREINTAFRKLSLKHHPDSGGSVEKFYCLQYCMAVIKEARGAWGIFDLALGILRVLL